MLIKNSLFLSFFLAIGIVLFAATANARRVGGGDRDPIVTQSVIANFCVNLNADTSEGPNQSSVSGTKGSDGCISGDLMFYAQSNCQGDGISLPPFGATEKDVINSVFIGNPVCQEVVEGRTNSPFLGYKITSGGTLYKFCIDLATGRLTFNSLCGF
jgi:hypothetical protein